VRTTLGLPAHVRPVDRAGTGLPALPQVALALWRRSGEPGPAADRLASLLVDAIRGAAGGAAG